MSSSPFSLKTWVACNPSNPGQLIHLSANEVTPGMVAAPLGLEQYLPCWQASHPKYIPITNPDTGTETCTFVPVAARGALGGMTLGQCKAYIANNHNHPTAMYSCVGGSCVPSPGLCGPTTEAGLAQGCYMTKGACQAAAGECYQRPTGPIAWVQAPAAHGSDGSVSSLYDPRSCRPMSLTHAKSLYGDMGLCSAVGPTGLPQTSACYFPADTPRSQIPHVSQMMTDASGVSECTPGLCVPYQAGPVVGSQTGASYGAPCSGGTGSVFP